MEKVLFSFDENLAFTPLNIKNVAAAFGIDPIRVIYPIQSHEDRIAEITKKDFEGDGLSGKLINTDALITRSENILIAVKTADCVPILIYDTQQNIIAAVHAGWRGTAKDIIGKTIRKLKNEFNCNVFDLIAVIGPSIGMDNYEVGIEVIEQIQQNLKSFTWFQKVDYKYFADLKEANCQLLQHAGVNCENIEVLNYCTHSNQEFYSARRDKEKAGRMLNGILLKA